jgi:hypothetical protein
MMDAMSEQPAPSDSEIVECILNKVKHEFEPFGVCEDEIRLVAQDELSNFGAVGSLAAWYRITCNLLVKNLRISLRKKFGIVQSNNYD